GERQSEEKERGQDRETTEVKFHSQAGRRRGATLPVCDVAKSSRRADSKRAITSVSATEGQVMFSPLSSADKAASTRSSVDMTDSGASADRGTPDLSQTSVAVAAGSTTWTFTPVSASSC